MNKYPLFTGCYDLRGIQILRGDHVVYHNTHPRTKKEYWEPEYIVVFDPPSFTLKHVGGGKDVGSHLFHLKYGGPNGNLEIIRGRTTYA